MAFVTNAKIFKVFHPNNETKRVFLISLYLYLRILVEALKETRDSSNNHSDHPKKVSLGQSALAVA